MAELTISLGLVDSCDRTSPIVDGSVRGQGVEFITTTTSPSDLFRRQTQFSEFDVSEMSVSTFVALLSHGDQRFVGLPVFPRRAFRHGFMFVNRASGISDPKDLEDRRVGVSEYQQTASLWIRGILRDEYGVRTERIKWFEGGLDRPDQLDRLPLRLPESIKLERIGRGKTLSDMLQTGELDALIGPRRPRCFIEEDPSIGRLIPDYRRTEQEYYERTRHFPIMHMMVIRRDLADSYPWLPANLVDVFEAAKRESDRRFAAMADRSCGMPWLLDDVEELRRVFKGEDHWPYGITRNRHTLDAILEMSFAEGLSSRRVQVDELFAQQVSEQSPIQFA